MSTLRQAIRKTLDDFPWDGGPDLWHVTDRLVVAVTGVRSEASADLPATLASVDDVRRACVEHGLTENANGRAWFDDRVSVRIVNGEFGWQVSIRDGMGGALVAEVGDFGSLPSCMLVDAIQAARSAS